MITEAEYRELLDKHAQDIDNGISDEELLQIEEFERKNPENELVKRNQHYDTIIEAAVKLPPRI
ncbi:MAG: hypothetical protein COV55_04980 [Candidatus Komeilibacteria bacterium CG11_big_fil_rev_8_21_14_0_20_36_20]|uniref:Uncharacterized protein n=2 Tax=Patescibacteria group TaxID=1783273 RepID=A0A2H0NB07_9BACT|nr:MAG: hypothetical protein COV55_04980 [Candidatus Komeilibacteria bacterium CG11_big_fil_rev_8_21_14_0_20_36_20]PIR82055.1 MAG: hypothetical protein COU21_00215 [Candidatus Komeilibacteria bacterium CG10_big_fil_rev_8_21_14_0_10_36_65]PIZ65025.1 MAG: hypothetical protein COY14_03245 [Candidatus Roizmanbacteria bacterium CG_4_10_14_0_2_um_filter_36_9]PJC55034.1 MAG: hypothetical protein CO027_04200 [Candidatus Komeilibacteria bacterium CG_4_9_14_0_2_um_filter_36_13]